MTPEERFHVACEREMCVRAVRAEADDYRNAAAFWRERGDIKQADELEWAARIVDQAVRCIQERF